MNKDFIIGLLLGILVALFIIWLFDRDSDDSPTPDDSARQPVPKYADNTIPLDEAV